MLHDASPDAGVGDLVHVYTKRGEYFGRGLYDPLAKMPLRVYHHHHHHHDQLEGDDADHEFGEAGLTQLVQSAVDLRTKVLRLPERTDAFRVINSDGDGLSGLIVDKYADVLSIEVHSVGVYQRLKEWIPLLHEVLGTRRHRIATDIRRAGDASDDAGLFEELDPGYGSDPVHSVTVKENEVEYEVNFESGHKTGFFCDQRDNRQRFAQLVRDRTVLDLCCYTGGFAIAAATTGRAKHVTAVDLDEQAIAQARRNAAANALRHRPDALRFVHADAFVYARQLEITGQRFDVVLCDPPKFIDSRDERETARGLRKYEDLNALAAGLVAPGGLLVTCSCSGLLSETGFEEVVARAVHKRNRRMQVLNKTGAGEDHPILASCPESRYLKVVWARML